MLSHPCPRPRVAPALRTAGAVAILTLPLTAQTVQLEDFLLGASDAEANDEFAAGIAVDGTRAAIGAGRADVGPNVNANHGIVYVFEDDGTTWNETAILRASDAAAGDEFGADLDLQGDVLAIGARFRDLTTGGDQGAVYVFRYDGSAWIESEILTAGGVGALGDQFGHAVELEGEFLFVASQFRDAAGSTLGDEGAVFVYQDVGGTFVPFVQLVASDAEELELFGSGISADGDRLLVGAQHESDGIVGEAGAAYVFEFDGVSWTETAKLLPSTRHDDQHFGSDVALDGDRLVVGAEENDAGGGTVLHGGALWVFEHDGSAWVETAFLEASDVQDGDNLGFSVDLHDDFIVGGAPFADVGGSANQGAAYVFEFSGGSWSQAAKLQTTNGAAGDDTGREVYIAGDEVVLSARVAKPGVGNKVGGAFFYDLDLNAAAVHADFVTASGTAGKAPLTVDFEDRSQGGPSSWSWDFGDGGTSTLASPAHVYTADGTYDVSLTVTGVLGTDTEVQQMLVQVGPPTAFYQAIPPAGLVSTPFLFLDQSVGAVDTYAWNFKDGTTSSERSPLHTFPSKGLYRVALQVVGPGGLSVHAKFIPVLDGDSGAAASDAGAIDAGALNAAFFADVTSGEAPLDVLFTDASTGAVTSWSWDLGDGSTSSLQSPAHTYVGAGTYTVVLTVSDGVGSDTETKVGYIVVTEAAPVAEFAADVTSGTAPLDVVFGDLSTGAVTGWSWDLGDGTTSTLQNPSHTYAAAGTYDVALTVTGPGGADTETKVGYIVVTEAAPVAEFAADVTTGTAPLDVVFGDLSTGAVTGWSWDLGDGTTSTLQNPSHTYAAAGTYDVALTVTGPGGADTETKVGYIVVTEAAPVAEFAADVTTGTAPLDVVFGDLSTGAVTSWSWDLGDGTTSTLQNPSHTYAAAGTYDVALTVTGPGGADTETKVGYIVVTEAAPVAEFAADVTTGTAPLDVVFGDLSTGAVTGWSWDFGDGTTSTLQNPSHTYAAAGTYDVALTVTGPGGADTETKVGYIVVSEAAPVAEFAADVTTGTAPLDVVFGDLSTGAVTSWSWDLGDGTTSTLQNPSHTYAAAGTYDVALTVTGPGGADTETKVGYIVVSEAAPVAEFAADVTTGTAPLDVVFGDLSTGAVTSWSWDLGDGTTSTLQNPSHTYAAAGTYDVALTVTGPGGADTETKVGYIVVTEAAPVAEFAADVTTGTAPLDVVFGDLSTGAVTSWSWDLGDGTTSTLQNPSHTYAAAGTYDVALTVTGPGGADTETKVGYIVVTEAAPVAEFAADVTTGTAPLDVVFGDLSTGAVTSWSWDFGDGTTSTLQNPSHTYAAAGTYDVALTVTGPGGADTETKVGYIVVTP